MRLLHSSQVLIVIVFFGACFSLGNDKPRPVVEDAVEEKENSANWAWPVAIPENSPNDVQAASERLRKLLKIGLSVIQANENPVCCLWLEVGAWNPNPSDPGYLIIIQQGGGKIMASDVKQLNIAIDRLGKLSRKDGDRIRLPIGVITSYHVVDEKGR